MAPVAKTFERYGAVWPTKYDRLMVEFACIKQGGEWTNAATGAKCGKGLFYHYRHAQSLLWPEDDHHRWSDLMLKTFLERTITAVLGPKDSAKTHTSAKFALLDYYIYPNETLVLISSTDLRGLEMRVWGDLKSMHEKAKRRFSWLAGNTLESKHAICTDNLEEDEVRDMRKGIICIPCLSSSGQFVGLGRYVGLKQKRRRLVADECQFMRESFLESLANLNSGDFKGVFLGNPIGQDDPLDKISEPKEGWSSLAEPTATSTWENRWINGRTINLVGTDSPNFDADTKDAYPYLINQRSIDNTVAFYGMNSLQYSSQCQGVRRTGMNAHRVITREMCEQNHAFDDVTWGSKPLTAVAALDAAYGGVGGDRCIGGHIIFGEDVSGNIVVACSPPVLVPVSVKKPLPPETQIARFMRDYCEQRSIPPQNFFFDARGSLAIAFAKEWSASVEAVEFGAGPTNRPVSLDLYIYDPLEHKKRLKLCKEHYSKFVTELWFSVRYVIEGGQMRQLPDEVAKEGYMREWKLVRSDKYEVESKDETRERMGRSPDMFDWLVTAVEGARRHGFAPRKLANIEDDASNFSWLDAISRRHRTLIHKNDLNYRI